MEEEKQIERNEERYLAEEGMVEGEEGKGKWARRVRK